MTVIVGAVVVLAAVLTGFSMAGGHVGVLIHPSEFVTIGGAALGALIVMSPKKVLVDLLRGILQSVKGTPYNRQAYEDLFKMSYELFRIARQGGLMALESHISSPHESAVFEKYPRIANDHHVMQFMCGALSPMLDGTTKPEQLPAILAGEVQMIEAEQHGPLNVLSKTADSLPGFGIVAAVLGIVVTMRAIDGPVEEIGEKVGAALVGTFLGILLSYGFFAPMTVRMEFLGDAQLGFFRTISVIIQGFGQGAAPKVAIDQARRAMPPEMRMEREELDKLFESVDKAQE
jgi:chemotaxis protein MotA